MNKENVVYITQLVLSSLDFKKKGNPAICGTRMSLEDIILSGHHRNNQNKGISSYMYFELPYMWNQKVELLQVENRKVVTRGWRDVAQRIQNFI
jgi:hypothetical protein